MTPLTIAILMFITWLLLRVGLGIRVDYVAGLFVYGTGRVIYRTGRGFLGLGKRAIFGVKVPRRRHLEPVTLHNIESKFRLGAFEVVLSLKEKIVRVDIGKDHTLVGGVTGFGKTSLINLILIQLFNKGKRFTDACDVYLIDLKGDDTDFLHSYKPLLAGYFSITDDGDALRAIQTLNGIVETMHQRRKEGGGTKRILVIIDEVALLTVMSSDPVVKREGQAALSRLAGQLRSRGNIIAATQYPRYDVVPTTSRFNLGRKICFYVDNPSMAQVILGVKPEAKELPTEKGEFIMREPGKPGLIKGHAIFPNIPGDIDRVVYKLVADAAESDERLKLFKDVAGSKQIGDKIIGITNLAKTYQPMSSHDINVAYQNFALCGAFLPPQKKGMSSQLAMNFADGVQVVKKYIEDGRWQEDPGSVIGMER